MHGKRQVKLRLLFIQLITIIPFLLIIFYLIDLWYDSQRTAALEQNIQYAKLSGELLKNLIAGEKFTATLVSGNTVISDKKATQKMLQNISGGNAAIIRISATDLQNLPVYTYPENNSADSSSFVQLHREAYTGKTTITHTSDDNPDYLLMSTPVTNQNTVTGYIDMVVNLNYYKKILERTLQEDAGRTGKNIYFFDEKGKLRFSLNSPLRESSETAAVSLSESECYRTSRSGQTYVFENDLLTPLSPHRLIGACTPVESSGWTVVSATRIDDIYKPIYSIQTTIWLGLLAALLFSLSLTSFILRKINIY